MITKEYVSYLNKLTPEEFDKIGATFTEEEKKEIKNHLRELFEQDNTVILKGKEMSYTEFRTIYPYKKGE